MWSRLLLILLLFGLLGDTAAERGRDGNALFAQERYAEAEAAYRDGLAALSDTTGAVYAALQNNLGAALLRQRKHGAARTAFDRARRAAPTEAERVRALFNAGTAAAGQGALDTALRRFRRVLLLDPSHNAARYNYEYLKRREQEEGESSDTPDVEPSPYARRLKERAEAMVAERRYEDAAALMRNGLKQDSTVQAYRDFMARLDDVAQISARP